MSRIEYTYHQPSELINLISNHKPVVIDLNYAENQKTMQRLINSQGYTGKVFFCKSETAELDMIELLRHFINTYRTLPTHSKEFPNIISKEKCKTGYVYLVIGRRKIIQEEKPKCQLDLLEQLENLDKSNDNTVKPAKTSSKAKSTSDKPKKVKSLKKLEWLEEQKEWESSIQGQEYIDKCIITT